MLSQAMGAITQVVTAAYFGASPAMDAFLAANNLPQYLVTVMLGAVGYVFLPVFMESRTRDGDESAWRFASTLLNSFAAALAILGAAGCLFAEPLLRATTPGLDESTFALAIPAARLLWFAMIPTALSGIIVSLHHGYNRFTLPAIAPLIAGPVYISFVVVLAKWGTLGLAWALLASVIVQVAVLLPFIRKDWRPTIEIGDPAFRRFFQLLAPLLASGFIIRCTPLIDRFIASHFESGSLAHLGYASRLIAVLPLVISSGLSTVLFPRMAAEHAGDNHTSLRRTIVVALKAVCFVGAPVIIAGTFLAEPVIRLLFERGEFTSADTTAVTRLFRIYLFALVGMTIGDITGRALYAMQAMRLVAIMGVIETAAYALYAPALASGFGIDGIAMAYVTFMSVSVLWQFLFLWRRLR